MERSRVRLVGVHHFGELLLTAAALVSATGCSSILATGMYVLQGGNMVPAACDALQDHRVVVVCRPPASNRGRNGSRDSVGRLACVRRCIRQTLVAI